MASVRLAHLESSLIHAALAGFWQRSHPSLMHLMPWRRLLSGQRLRCIVKLLERGQVPVADLKRNLEHAASLLEYMCTEESRQLVDPEDELDNIKTDSVPVEVRDWLTVTFTQQKGLVLTRREDKQRFRSIVHAVQAGIFVERMFRRTSSLSYSQNVITALKVQSVYLPVCEGAFVLHSLNQIPVSALMSFVDSLEVGYSSHKNPYHNLVHAADVTQTLHYLLIKTGILHWLSELEIFAVIFAAAIHDYEHTGTTNNFHIQTRSDTALLYNDRAVQENHHISAAYRLLQRDDDKNIFVNLSKDEWRDLRSLVVDMVLATDMSCHFQQIKGMKNLMMQREHPDKPKALSLLLHTADISHPAKQWGLHHRWTTFLLEEFFRQGDKEAELGLPFSPLCDRKSTMVAQSQIGFIDFIVEPTFTVVTEMIETITTALAQETPPSGQTTKHPGDKDSQLPVSVIHPATDELRPPVEFFDLCSKDYRKEVGAQGSCSRGRWSRARCVCCVVFFFCLIPLHVALLRCFALSYFIPFFFLHHKCGEGRR
uniref:Phosphodiesterase n=1 Tax=Oryzias sinensis TaxID=183150 RepID=A0A8C7XI43_9TELE